MAVALAANGRGIGRQWPRHWPPFVVKLGLFVFVLVPVIRKMSAETRPVIYELFDPRDGGLPRPLQTKKEPVCPHREIYNLGMVSVHAL